ncbi:aminoacetone oxidase family FAD-binding enzyme [Adlercreutzia shanghongiae]|uniref:Aminoacetone oxidase family FAD-binding enzyme n=1 Tax=Adlercreutzia shanghongiae TaxID=3111773 RepID=A0ABU6J0Q6_9ACTN|nr:aminoacetone oxidase family FAD-binding enzyme [Adlercreutzia sp. R22]MEC4295490.1 aminoacetone oxidase family FAD-binding enzyme [Adlercreutzia sp. R22]
MKRIAIIGGGASGLSAAAAAASFGAPVALYEASDRVGRSILATGNGRCNFSNSVVSADDYRNPAFVGEVLARLESASRRHVASQAEPSTAYPNGVLGFFADCGLVWREEGEGRLYPLANKATSVLDCLRAACAAAGVEEHVGCEVAAVEPPRGEGGRFTLRLADGRFERADAVIVAVGGSIVSSLLPVGVRFRATEPILGPLATEGSIGRRLDNIRVRGALELWRRDCLVSRERGEVMFRKYGVSGIAAFNLSRLAHPGDELAVDFVPDVSANDAEAFLNRRRKMLRSRLGRDVRWGDMLRGMVLAPVADVLLHAAGLEENRLVAKGDAPRMAPVLKGLRMKVTGLGDARQCQVRRGGIDVGAVDARSCELRCVPGLYVVGEALDVDAPCGGYNLHWAWASGLLAGWSAMEVWCQ